MKENERNSPDRKTRRDGDRVIHTVQGVPFHGDENLPPRGLTVEQAEEQRNGSKLDERQVREAAHGEQQSTPVGDVNRIRRHADAEGKNGSDELTAPPYGKHQR